MVHNCPLKDTVLEAVRRSTHISGKLVEKTWLNKWLKTDAYDIQKKIQ